ncbi:MAG: helix-turn-helix domain-containing protein, partial [Bacteroidales bacterium]|nr:helix-turn-helix domain-containing protein [Bacteroidales bacterium]
MPQANYFDKDFLLKATEIVEDHLSDERFGVSELAGAMGMSRSNLLRKIQKLTGLSVSRFVRQIRLKHAKELLVSGTINVSEAAWKTGFSSTSYFVKCFREQYGYPPGEVSQHATKTESDTPGESSAFTHQLAAIMFTDIEGYTALMQKDEHQAVAFRNRHRKIFNAAIEKYNGKILQYYGDGTLSTFSSAIDAVKCGIEMQLDFLQEPELPVRIGIHSGDIIFTHDDIIGDGVNVASRIESLAVSGSVFISEKVFDEIKNQPGIKTVSMGRFDLKNIDKPIEVYAIAKKGLTVPEKSSISGKTKSQSQSEISSQQFQKKNKT